MMNVISCRFLKDLEEEVLNDDSYVWKEESESEMETVEHVAPASPQNTSETRSVSLLRDLWIST